MYLTTHHHEPQASACWNVWSLFHPSFNLRILLTRGQLDIPSKPSYLITLWKQKEKNIFLNKPICSYLWISRLQCDNRREHTCGTHNIPWYSGPRQVIDYWICKIYPSISNTGTDPTVQTQMLLTRSWLEMSKHLLLPSSLPHTIKLPAFIFYMFSISDPFNPGTASSPWRLVAKKPWWSWEKH